MLKKLLTVLVALFAVAAFAAVDVNKATQAELESVKGIGPDTSSKILDERKKGAFKDWNDLIERVKGVGEGNAAKFSAAGLTVGNASFKGAAPAAKKADVPATKAAATAAPATPVTKAAATAAPATPGTPAVAAAPAAKPADKSVAVAKPADKPVAAASAPKK
jgi:competence protein ComEA